MEKARLALEPPPIALQKLCFSPITITVVRIAVKFFDVFTENPGADIAVDEIASKAAGSKDLAVRLIRHLTAPGILEEVSKGRYKAQPLGLMCSSTSPAADAIINFYTYVKSLGDMNDFLAESGYENPGDASKTPRQFAYKTDKKYFDWLADHPLGQRAFNTCMSMHDAYRPQDWYEFYPVTEKLGAQSDRVALVDISGGTGGDIKKFQAKFPVIGNLVLQDLPSVVSAAKDLPAGIKAEAYDMFTPQPVKGAEAYYMRTVLHDWPDKQARVALQNIRAAMSQDSVLLLNDNVMSDSSLTQMDTSVEFTMMTCFASLERTEDHWLSLIKSAGFRVVKVYKPTVAGPQNIALFEAVPA